MCVAVAVAGDMAALGSMNVISTCFVQYKDVQENMRTVTAKAGAVSFLN